MIISMGDLIGADRMQLTLKQAVRDFDDLSIPGSAASRKILTAAKQAAPRRTGALANSHRLVPAQGRTAGVSAGVHYAPVIHWGWRGHNIEPNPWLIGAARRTEPSWVQDYLAYADRTIGQVEGI